MRRISRWTLAVAGLALAALVAAGCGSGGQGTAAQGGGGGASAEAKSAPARSGGSPNAAPAGTPAPSTGDAAGAAKAGGIQLVDLGNRIVRKAAVDLEVGRGKLNETVSRATDVVSRHRGIYVSASTSVPDKGAARGQVTFRVPVDAFEATLDELKGLGAYRGEQSSTEDVTGQYVDQRAQLAAWRAQERVYLRLLDRAKSIADVISVQNQLEQVQSNINRLQGQVDFLEDQSSFSTIQLNLSEPGAVAAAGPRGRLARAWATAVTGLGVMGAAALVALIWLLPAAGLGLLVWLALRGARHLRPLPAGTGPTPPAAP